MSRRAGAPLDHPQVMGAAGSNPLTILRRVLANRELRRVELAFAGFNVAEYGGWVAVLVYAYERSGTTVTAFVAVAQLIPSAIVAPLAARTADRRGGAVALRRGYFAQAAAYGATAALLFTDAPALLVYGAAIVAATALTTTRPAQAALLPPLVDGPDELTAATVLSGWVESISLLAGPALAGVLIALDGPQAALCCFALLLAGSWALVSPLRLGQLDQAIHERSGRGGFAVLRADGGLMALVVVLAAQYVVIGVLDVLIVVLAVSALGLGAAGAGYLTAAFGAGGVLGSLAAVWLIGRRHLTPPLLAAAVGWASLLAILGAWPTVVGAFLLLAAAGTARSLLDVSGRTMLLRAAPAAVRGRVFGVLEAAAMLGLALGSILVPALVALGGAGAALIAVGMLLSAAALAAASRLHAVERANAPAMATAATEIAVPPVVLERVPLMAAVRGPA